jgi:hypothetical protein
MEASEFPTHATVALMRNGWQKVNPDRKRRGMTAEINGA